MSDLSTTYMGLTLKSPVIAASSGLTNTIDNIVKFEEAGAGAIVLKSLFEEQIIMETEQASNNIDAYYPEAYDYISNYAKGNATEKYLTLVREAKERVAIPIIASINCVSAGEWISYAKMIEKAGADALEINIYRLPSDMDKKAEEMESVYFELAEKLLKEVKIPVSFKIGKQFSALGNMIQRLSWTGIKGLVLFNRFYSPDIDTNTLEISHAKALSHPEEYADVLRWTAISSPKIRCDIAATTGIHSGNTAIKMLLAGAKVVEIASICYEKGIDHIRVINKEIEEWMSLYDYANMGEFVGSVAYNKKDEPAAFERVQFMKYFSGIE